MDNARGGRAVGVLDSALLSLKLKPKNLKYMENKKTNLKYRSYNYALKIIRLVDGLNTKKYSEEVISKQLLRSATSIGANIVEAQAGSSKKDFTNFYNHALKSANETKFWLGLLRDTGKCNAESINQLISETGEVANILGASIITLRKNKKSF